MLKTVSDKVDKSSEAMERRLSEVQHSANMVAIDISELKQAPTNVPTASSDYKQKQPSFKEVAEMLDNIEERTLNRISSHVQQVALDFELMMEHNNNDLVRRFQTSLQEVSDKIDVVSGAAYNPGGQVQEETSITPDSEDVHELKGV